MGPAAAESGGGRMHRIQQAIKWTVYTLLLVNFGFYIAEDWNRAMHSLDAGATLFQWTTEFATSIDELGWFLLLAMFELETYVLEDDQWTGWSSRLIRGVRFACFLMIGHTIVAYGAAAFQLQSAPAVSGVDDLCELADGDTSFVYNLGYTTIDGTNCDALSDASQFYWVTEGTVVTDPAGLELEQALYWADVVEASAWLIIVLAIEAVVRLQDRGISSGRAISLLNGTQLVLYLLLVVFAIWWATLSHWLYFWDELLWIGGFAAIEMNLSEWRDELRGSAKTGAPAS